MDVAKVAGMRAETLTALQQPYDGERPPCELHWDELTAQQQSLVRSLGFTAMSWVDDTWSNVLIWSALPPLLLAAARSLGFDEASWCGELKVAAAASSIAAEDDAREAERRAQLKEAEAFQRIVDGEDADEELTEHEVPKLKLPALAPTVDYVEFDQLTADEKRNRLLPGTVVSVQWGIAPDGGLQFYLAVIVPPKTSGSGKTGHASVGCARLTARTASTRSRRVARRSSRGTRRTTRASQRSSTHRTSSA